MPNLIIGSRGSKLALWQAHWVKAALESRHANLAVAIEIIKTTGDKLTEASLVKIGGKGVFTKEIEDALLLRRIDLAVHSLKDLPTALPEGLHISAVTEREDVRDALIVSRELAGRANSIARLPSGARIGTSSLRRAAQLRHLRPDLEITELRGNIETRLRKLDEGAYDAIILASAGLDRLGFGERITERIDSSVMLSAVGQGALGLEARVDDDRTNFLLEALNHWPTRHAVEAERAVLRGLGGGCAVPIAALGRLVQEDDGRQLVLEALVADVAGRRVIRDQVRGPEQKGQELGSLLARRLIAQGAHELLPRVGEAPEAADDLLPEAEPEIDGEKLKAECAAASVSAPGSELAAAEQPPRDLPLAGRRVIVTRAAKQAGEITRDLESRGAQVISCPTIEIREPSSWEALDAAIERLSHYDWLAFTSANGVDFFLRRLDELGHGRAELTPHKICAVGRRTTERLKSEGLRVDLTPTKFTAESLAEAFIKRYGVGQRLRGAQMLLPAARTTRDVIRPALDKLGVRVDVVEAYQTILPAMKSEELIAIISNARADYIIFTSPSTAANLAALLETDHLAAQLPHTRVACIGPVTAEAARLHGLTVHIQPAEHTAQAIVQALIEDSRMQGEDTRPA
jgi:hydroxymethylbilane synthase